jgi:hypothetical protein
MATRRVLGRPAVVESGRTCPSSSGYAAIGLSWLPVRVSLTISEAGSGSADVGLSQAVFVWGWPFTRISTAASLWLFSRCH